MEIETTTTIGDSHLSPGIDVAKLGAGSVDNTELGYLNGVNAAIQSQFDGIGISLANFNGTVGSLQTQLNNLGSSASDLSSIVSGKVSKAGDTMTGTLNLPPDGFAVGTDQFAVSGGKVGIGTTGPAAKLDVRGDVKLGSAGELFASGAEENLRIVRGTVRFAGGNTSIVSGGGFSVSPPSSENFTINFDRAFSGPPTVTVSLEITEQFVTIISLRSVTATEATVSDGASLNGSLVHIKAIGPR